MATAVINKAPPVIQPPTTVTLTLSMDEAEVLKFIIGKVRGPAESPRSLATSIYHSLDQVVVGGSYNKQDSDQSIRFI